VQSLFQSLKGLAEKVKNYTPISLTCVAGKIIECIIAVELYEHRCNDLLSAVQHGFIKGKCTCTIFLEYANDWTISLRNKHSTIVAYIDFSRAFDTVSLCFSLLVCIHMPFCQEVQSKALCKDLGIVVANYLTPQ